MIEIIEGKGVGAGKSYFVIERLMSHWQRGGTAYVAESFFVVWDECKRLTHRRTGFHLEDDQYNVLTAEKIATLHEHTPPGTEECPLLIILDEVQDQLNARDWNDKSKRDLFAWCCQSRHDDNDLLFVSQAAANIDKQIRRLATFTWSVRNAENFSMPGVGNVASNIRLVTLGLNNGKYFIRNQLDYDGRTQLDRKWVKADAALFKCYRSKSMRATRKRLGEGVAKKQLRRDKGRHPMIKWLILGSIVLLFWAGCQFKANRDKKKELRNAPKSEAKQKASAPSATPTPAPVAAYDIRQEPWLAMMAEYLKTPSGEYITGELSPDGFVEGIKGNIVRVRKPDGRILYIIGKGGVPVTDRNVNITRATPSPTMGPIIIAPDTTRTPDRPISQTTSLPSTPPVVPPTAQRLARP